MSQPEPPPQPPLIGHSWVQEFLTRGAQAGRLSHAYLFTGPAHVGKLTTALRIAAVLLCEESRACGQCRHCRLAQRISHPDLRVLEMPTDRKNIPLRDLHEFLSGLALRPLEANRKVYVINEADTLAEEGANALLKSLEEPPERVVFLLSALSADTLEPTIVSRCQVIALHPVAVGEIAGGLRESHGVDPDRAEAVARASRGLPGWALTAIEDPSLLTARSERATRLVELLRAPTLERIRSADSLSDRWGAHSDEVKETLDIWAEVWRDVLLHRLGLRDRVNNTDLAEEIASVASELDPDSIERALAETTGTLDALQRNAHPRLAIGAYVLLLPHLDSARRGLPVSDTA